MINCIILLLHFMFLIKRLLDVIRYIKKHMFCLRKNNFMKYKIFEKLYISPQFHILFLMKFKLLFQEKLNPIPNHVLIGHLVPQSQQSVAVFVLKHGAVLVAHVMGVNVVAVNSFFFICFHKIKLNNQQCNFF